MTLRFCNHGSLVNSSGIYFGIPRFLQGSYCFSGTGISCSGNELFIMEEQSRPIIQPGEQAPNFSIKDQYSRTFDLLEQMGKRVLLSFHPLAWTDFCADQMTSLEENQQKFTMFNTVAVGISVDSVPCKKAWADHLKIKETLILADFWPHGKVANSYGLFRDTKGSPSGQTSSLTSDRMWCL